MSKLATEISDELLSHFEYDETSPSCLRWKKVTSGRMKIGDVAGNNKQGYFRIKFNYKDYLCHRIVYALFNKLTSNLVVDHIDRNIRNNKIKNLRAVTHSLNSKNRKPNESKFKTGIYFLEKSVVAEVYLLDGSTKRKSVSYLRKGLLPATLEASEWLLDQKKINLYIP